MKKKTSEDPNDDLRSHYNFDYTKMKRNRTQGRSREEAIENARDAVGQYIALEEDKLPVRPETFATLVVAV